MYYNSTCRLFIIPRPPGRSRSKPITEIWWLEQYVFFPCWWDLYKAIDISSGYLVNMQLNVVVDVVNDQGSVQCKLPPLLPRKAPRTSPVCKLAMNVNMLFINVWRQHFYAVSTKDVGTTIAIQFIVLILLFNIQGYDNQVLYIVGLHCILQISQIRSSKFRLTVLLLAVVSG